MLHTSECKVSASKTSKALQDLGMLVTMCIALLAAYWPCLQGTKIWDDEFQITPVSLRSLHGLWRIWTVPGAESDYYPIFHTAFWVEHRLWGEHMLGYHLVNLTEHAIAALLVVLIVRSLALPGAWLSGMLFALHPVCVESVAWMTEQKNTLSAMFYMAAALAYLHFDRSRRRSLYLIAFGLFVLAILSKSVVATLPGALLVVLWWQRGHLSWRRDVQPLLPWFVVGAAFSLFTGWVEWHVIGASGHAYNMTFLQHLLLAGRIPFFYASKVVWPTNLMFTYPRWSIDPHAWWQYLYPLALVLVLATFVDYAIHGRRSPLAALLYFLGTLFPLLGLLHIYYFRFSFVADHFQYLATLAIFVPAACLLSRIKWKPAAILVQVTLLVILGALTWRQSATYRDPETLYRATLKRNPGSFMAHTNLGWILARKPGQLPKAIAEYQAALQIQPLDERAHNDLGIAWAQTGRLLDAITEFQTALQLKSNYANAHVNLGNAWLQTGNAQAAIAEYESALKISPEDAKAHADMGNALAQTGRVPEAILQYEAVIELRPDSVAARSAREAIQELRGLRP